MGAEDGGVDGAVRRLGAVAERELEPVRERVGREDVVSAAHERLDEQQAREPAADDEHAPPRDPFERAQHTGERLREGAHGVVEVVRERQGCCRPGALGEPARQDRRLGEPLAGRLVPRAAPVAFAARQVVHERDAPPLGVLGDDLVPQHRPGRGAAELLHVRSAEAARAHGDEVSGAAGLRDVGERRLPGAVQDDGLHRGNGRARRRSRQPASAPPVPQRAARPVVPAGSPPIDPRESRLPSPFTAKPWISGTPLFSE